MAILTPYQSNAGISVGNAGSAGPHVNASAFMTPGQAALPDGLNKLAQGMDKLGGAIFDVALKKRQEQMELALIEDMQGFQSRSQAFGDSYQQQKRGRDAANAEDDAKAFYQTEMDALRERWKGNDRAQLYIQQHGGNLVVSGVNAMRDYGNKQQEAWKDSTFAGTAAKFKDVVSDPLSTPEERRAAYAEFTSSYVPYLLSKGMDPTKARIETDRVYRDAMAAGLGQKLVDQLNNKDVAGAGKTLAAMEGKVPALGKDNANARDLVGTYIDHPNVRTFLNMIAQAEGTHGRGDGGYNVNFGGSTFEGYGAHPGISREFTQTDGKKNHTTAAGRYQFIKGTFEDAAKALGLTDFSPRSQDAAAVWLMARRGALDDVVNGNGQAAVAKLGDEWASLPSSTAPQPKRSAEAVNNWLQGVGLSSGPLVPPDKIAHYESLLKKAEQDKLRTDAIQLYSAKYQDDPAKASWAAFQDKELAKDPQAQKAVVEYFDWRAGQVKAEKKQAELAQLEGFYGDLRKAAESRDIQQINSIILAAEPENMAKLEAFSKRILNGDGLVSDPEAKIEMMERISKGEPVEIDAEYGERLSLHDLAAGKSALQRKDEAAYFMQEHAGFNVQAQRWLGSAGKSLTKGKTIAKLFERFKAGIPKDDLRNPEKRQKLMDGFFKTITLEKPGWIFDSTKDVPAFLQEDYMREGYYPKSGEYYQKLVEELAARGIPVTDKALSKLAQDIAGGSQ